MSRPDSSTDHLTSQAPGTQDAAHESPGKDQRGIPGGGHNRSTAALGMESLSKDESVASHPDQTRSGDASGDAGRKS
jgi:hypothetical protein